MFVSLQWGCKKEWSLFHITIGECVSLLDGSVERIDHSLLQMHVSDFVLNMVLHEGSTTHSKNHMGRVISSRWNCRNEQSLCFTWDIRKEQLILPTVPCGRHTLSNRIDEGVASHSYNNRWEGISFKSMKDWPLLPMVTSHRVSHLGEKDGLDAPSYTTIKIVGRSFLYSNERVSLSHMRL